MEEFNGVPVKEGKYKAILTYDNMVIEQEYSITEKVVIPDDSGNAGDGTENPDDSGNTGDEAENPEDSGNTGDEIENPDGSDNKAETPDSSDENDNKTENPKTSDNILLVVTIAIISFWGLVFINSYNKRKIARRRK